MTALARPSSNCKRETRPLVREGAPHQQALNCVTVIQIWSLTPDGGLTPRQTGRLTIGRNMTGFVELVGELDNRWSWDVVS
jgi:hypothetical protein